MSFTFKSKIDVIITDDNEIYHNGLESVLAKLEFIGKITHAWNGKEALTAMQEYPHHLIFMDYRMPVMDGSACTVKIKKQFPDVKIIGISLYDDCASVLTMVESGIDGYLLKNTSLQEIETAVEKIFTGRHYFTPEVSQYLIDKAVENLSQGDSPFSDRENEILRLMWKDMTNKNISTELDISERTVETHRQNMFQKANVHTIVGLIKYALRNRIITDNSAD
ncbi:MAG TPA: response regulator transcription factor [Bacteroidia bacterium]|nr:response regulator transcription factor [Bacteroidia bacterium]